MHVSCSWDPRNFTTACKGASISLTRSAEEEITCTLCDRCTPEWHHASSRCGLNRGTSIRSLGFTPDYQRRNVEIIRRRQSLGWPILRLQRSVSGSVNFSIFIHFMTNVFLFVHMQVIRVKHALHPLNSAWRLACVSCGAQWEQNCTFKCTMSLKSCVQIGRLNW